MWNIELKQAKECVECKAIDKIHKFVVRFVKREK